MADRKNLRGSLLLVLTALIWGVAFVAQSVGMDYVRPFTFNAVRFLLGGLVLVPVVFLRERGGAARFWKREGTRGGTGRFREREGTRGGTARFWEREETRRGIWGGILCGAVLCAATGLQQFGILMTTVGKAGFITALYIVIVPLLGLFTGKKTPAHVWVSVALAVAGMYLLCVTEGLRIGKGDLYMLACAVCFSFHILLVDRVSPRADGVLLSCVQFFTAGALALVPALLRERPSPRLILAAWKPIAYAGILSCGVAYTLQVIAQRDTDPTVASLLMSLESVFSLLAGWLLLGERLSLRELAGCLLMFCAVILAQLPARRRG